MCLSQQFELCIRVSRRKSSAATNVPYSLESSHRASPSAHPISLAYVEPAVDRCESVEHRLPQTASGVLSADYKPSTRLDFVKRYYQDARYARVEFCEIVELASTLAQGLELPGKGGTLVVFNLRVLLIS